MVTIATILLLMSPVAAVNIEAMSSLKLDLKSGATPVAKIVTLLKDMQKTLEKEGEEDEETYEKMACWCSTNDKEKTKSIGEAKTRIEDLTAAIEEGTGSSSRLNTEIANLGKEVAKNQDALDKATAMRTDELAEFVAEEKDVLQSISALKSAIIVLSKHHGGASFLQVSSSQLSKVAQVMQQQLKKNTKVFEGVLTKSQKRKVEVFAQVSKGQTHVKYAPASGEIFGILKAMKETFEANLGKSTKEEGQNKKDYEDLKATKSEEITAGKEQKDAKTQELANTDQKLADDKQDLDDTTTSLAEDEKFLKNLKETCTMLDQEFERRQKARQLELAGVSKALEILTSDDAHDLFSKSMKPVPPEFIQNRMQRSKDSHRRMEASKLLSNLAKKSNNPRLMTLALRVRLDAFTRVKKAIDEMITQLMKEKEDEIKHKDYCIENLNENEKKTERKDREKKDVLETIDDLTMTIDTLTKEIDTLKSEVSEMQLQMKHAGEDRELENKEFQTTVAEQRATAALLGKALDVLKSVYEKKAAAFNQEEDEDDQTPPVQFKKMEKNKNSGGVMGMIQELIDEAKALEAEAIRSEEEAQKAYEDFVKDTNASIETKTKEITTKSEELAKAADDKTKAEDQRDDILQELEMLNNEAADLHKACDFVLKNFDVRQEARDGEIEGLKQAKAILSGAKFIQYLQFSPDFKH
jgi:chromosome segregation ATPase